MTAPDLQPIRLLALDFDGVFTDNRVFVHQDGTESVACNRSDGLGLEMARDAGLEIHVISKERNPVVRARCEKLGLPVAQQIDDKLPVLQGLAAERGLEATAVAFVGNDVNDAECMAWAGLGIAVADAHESALRAADFVTRQRGGHGAVREVCDLWLAARERSASKADAAAAGS